MGEEEEGSQAAGPAWQEIVSIHSWIGSPIAASSSNFSQVGILAGTGQITPISEFS